MREVVMRGIGVLGPMRVVGDDDAPRPLRSQLQKLLLAVLASRRGRSVSTDELVDALWGDALPARPAAALQSQIFRLRRVLADAGCHVETEGSSYRLEYGRERLDAARFEHLVGEAASRAREPAVAIAWLDEALELWRGRPYLEVGDHDAVRADALRLDDLRAEAAEQRAELLLELGHRAEADRAAEALTIEHPFRERPIAIRMRTLAAAGRHADALRVYQEFRTTLGEELGIEPSVELHDLETDILRHEIPPGSAVGLPGNSLVGREVELAEVVARLSHVRVVTLTGPGGVGKTRLALHAAAKVAADHPDGVWLNELASVDSDDDVVSAVAASMRVQPEAGQSHLDRVIEFLRARHALVVLDNCEHVLEGSRALVARILTHAPDVAVLATSRVRLGVEGEHVVGVEPLPVSDQDDVEAPAVALFCDRAQAVRRDFALTADDAPIVAELCRRLGGLPLAIELAAARSIAQTPRELLDDISDHLGGLADPRRAQERHRSIDAVVAWSYDQLSAPERNAFRSASVFKGGFTGEALAAVTQLDRTDVADALVALVEQSLIRTDAVQDTTRFSMLEPIGQFADARLDEEVRGRLRSRHATWASTWIERFDTLLRGPDEARCARAIRAEFANLRAAHRWCTERDHHTAARISGALYWYAYWYGSPDAFDWAIADVDRADDVQSRTLATACATATLGACRRGDPTTARALAERGIDAATASDPVSARFVWQAISSAEVMAGNYERALDCQHNALELASRAGDTAQEARELAARALVLGYLNRTEAAHRELTSARVAAQASSCPTVVAFCDYVAGEIILERAPGDALPLLEGARDAGRRSGNRYLAAIAGLSALSAAVRAGDPATALHGFSEPLDYFERAGSRAQQWTTIRTLIETLTALGHNEAATVLHAAHTASASAPPLIGSDATRMARADDRLRSQLGPDRHAVCQARGASLADEAIALARRTVDDALAGRPTGRA